LLGRISAAAAFATALAHLKRVTIAASGCARSVSQERSGGLDHDRHRTCARSPRRPDGRGCQESFSQTREVLIALDLSRSMWTEDVGDSRPGAGKRTTENLLNSLKGESVGLIVFAGTAFVQVP